MDSKNKNKTKVFVGMSGGVDSSVAAALLKKQGHDVCGVFIRGWYPEGVPCSWREDRRDAMRVAAILDIPFHTVDCSEEYKKFIIDYMIKEYREGRTPNPDIMCNKYIKFDSFLKKAREMGADKIATGHYVRLQRKISNSKLQITNLAYRQAGKSQIQNSKSKTIYNLAKAEDQNKDQTYFLWTLGQDQLKDCLFPLGDYTKDEVREMAKKFELPVASKRDSQGLCFVGEFKMEDFLKEHIKPNPGKIINEKGEAIGEHNGVQYYTIGQRHGTGAHGGEPLYIVGKDIKNNTLTAVPENLRDKFRKKEVEAGSVNWIAGNAPDASKTYQARIRYRQPLQECRLEIEKDKIKAIFAEPQTGVASGQSLVVYDGDTMLGGGIII